VALALRDLLAKKLEYETQDRDSFLNASQNARLIASAERYYRAMYYATAESWNLRDRHMFETLNNLMNWRGKRAKAVVWAHNSHIGDAAATDMGKARDEINIGQLCRERFGADAALIGFGTDRGTVAAADDWDGPMKIKTVRPAHAQSYERLCLDSGVRRFLLDLREDRHKALRTELMHAAGHRCDLSTGNRAGEPLFRGSSPAAVRRLRVVRRNPRRDALTHRCEGGNSGDVSVRTLAGC
jgi:erythromycin esterase-like protein